MITWLVLVVVEMEIDVMARDWDIDQAGIQMLQMCYSSSVSCSASVKRDQKQEDLQ